MPTGDILQLASLPVRHPSLGTAFLREFGPPAIIRLSVDPTRLTAGTMSRLVDLDWLAHPGTKDAVHVQRAVGWNGLEHWLDCVCVQLPLTVNAQTLTEHAAIGIMGLLISDAEGAVLETVLPIGSGGDYFIRCGGNVSQVEVSGILTAETMSVATARLSQKSQQVLKHVVEGYVSVTTFACPSACGVHSYLHYVKKPAKKKRAGKKGKRQ